MPRPRRAARTRRQTITEGEALWAHGRLTQDHPDYVTLRFFTSKERLREVREEMREEVRAARAEDLVAWIGERPGTRPEIWWSTEAREPRRRLGGTGDLWSDHIGGEVPLSFGIPTDWVRPWQEAYYNGRALDIHGNAIGTEYSDGHFPYKAIDPNDPPLFESEATYLDRLGLLADEERARLGADAWEPEAVEPYDEEEATTDTPTPATEAEEPAP